VRGEAGEELVGVPAGELGLDVLGEDCHAALARGGIGPLGTPRAAERQPKSKTPDPSSRSAQERTPAVTMFTPASCISRTLPRASRPGFSGVACDVDLRRRADLLTGGEEPRAH
jgi:hypothetical protein